MFLQHNHWRCVNTEKQSSDAASNITAEIMDPETGTITRRDLRHLDKDILEKLTGLPKDQLNRKCLIYNPTRSSMQSGVNKTYQWYLQFQRSEAHWNNPLMGWVATSDPLTNVTLIFPSKEDAIRFAEQQGLEFEVEEEKHQRDINPRSYGDKFKYKMDFPEKLPF